MIAVNKQNYTHDMISRSGIFNISVLTESTGFEVFKNFGFQSGHNCNKFDGFNDVKRSENGLLYLTENSNAVISGKVVGSYDYETHTLFVAEITEAITLSGERSVTYTYYFEHIKPKPEQKNLRGRYGSA